MNLILIGNKSLQLDFQNSHCNHLLIKVLAIKKKTKGRHSLLSAVVILGRYKEHLFNVYVYPLKVNLNHSV